MFHVIFQGHVEFSFDANSYRRTYSQVADAIVRRRVHQLRLESPTVLFRGQPQHSCLLRELPYRPSGDRHTLFSPEPRNFPQTTTSMRNTTSIPEKARLLTWPGVSFLTLDSRIQRPILAQYSYRLLASCRSLQVCPGTWRRCLPDTLDCALYHSPRPVDRTRYETHCNVIGFVGDKITA